MSLDVRSQAEELMDADDLDAATYAYVVGDLAKVNTVTMARRPTLDFLERATAKRTSFRLLDVGFSTPAANRPRASRAATSATSPATMPTLPTNRGTSSSAASSRIT
jgi:hypothetical protein